MTAVSPASAHGATSLHHAHGPAHGAKLGAVPPVSGVKTAPAPMQGIATAAISGRKLDVRA